MIMENLRYLLFQYSKDYPIYFGARFRHFTSQGSVSGGAGYVLSRKSLQMLVEKGLPDKKLCNPGDIGTEDVTISKCLTNIGVIAGDDRDLNGRQRFFPMRAETHLNSTFDGNWYQRYAFYPIKQVLNIVIIIFISESDNDILFLGFRLLFRVYNFFSLHST